MQIKYYCDLANLNWSVVAGLPARMKELGMDDKEVGADLTWHPESQKLESLEGVPELVKLKGSPGSYNIVLKDGITEKTAFLSHAVGMFTVTSS